MRGDEGHEKSFFGLQAALCSTCRELHLERDVARLFAIDEADITSAIESDMYLRSRWDRRSA